MLRILWLKADSYSKTVWSILTSFHSFALSHMTYPPPCIHICLHMHTEKESCCFSVMEFQLVEKVNIQTSGNTDHLEKSQQQTLFTQLAHSLPNPPRPYHTATHMLLGESVGYTVILMKYHTLELCSRSSHLI